MRAWNGASKLLSCFKSTKFVVLALDTFFFTCLKEVLFIRMVLCNDNFFSTMI